MFLCIGMFGVHIINTCQQQRWSYFNQFLLWLKATDKKVEVNLAFK